MYYGERFNAWTHLVGAVLALIGAVWLIVLASLDGSTQKIVGTAIYGVSLALLFSVSTLYHSVQGRRKTFMRKLDHLSIYLMIAGSYTPFCLISLQGSWGWSLLAAVWGLALLGVIQELNTHTGARNRSLVIYTLMGWMMLVAINPLLNALGHQGVIWLLAGGMAYTIGIVFFIFDERYRHWHGIWHLWVIAGSALHYLTIMRYVL